MKQLVLTLALLLGLHTGLRAQDVRREAVYDHVQKLLGEGKWFEAKSIAEKSLSSYPDDVACMLGIAQASELEIRDVPLYRWQEVVEARERAEKAYQRVAEARGGDINAARHFFAKAMGDDKPSAKKLEAFCQTRIQAIQAYFQLLERHHEEAKAAEKAYRASLAPFFDFVKSYNYSEKLPIYLKEADMPRLDNIAGQFAESKKLIDALIADVESSSSQLSKANRISISWGVPDIDGRNVAPVAENDFLRQNIVAYDLRAWAEKIKQEGAAIQQLRQALYDYVKRLDAFEQQPQPMASYQALEKEVHGWLEQMKRYDNQCNLGYLTHYYLDKAKFHAMAYEYQQRREASFLHESLRKELIQQLYDQIDTAYGNAGFLESEQVYMPNQAPVMAHFGGMEGLKAIHEAEDKKWMDAKAHWRGVEMLSHSLNDNIPDQLSGDITLYTRPAKQDVKALLAQGAFVADEVERLSDATTLVYGHNQAGKGCIAKIGLDGALQWSKVYDGKVAFFTDYHAGGVAVVTPKGQQYQVHLADQAGQVLFDSTVGFLPQEALRAEDGIYFFGHSNGQLHVLACHPADGHNTYRSVPMKGQIVRSVLHENKLYLGLHYQQLSGLDGQALPAPHANQIAVGVFHMGGEGDAIQAIASSQQAVLLQIITISKQVEIKGLQGSYSLDEFNRYNGGEAFEATVVE